MMPQDEAHQEDMATMTVATAAVAAVMVEMIVTDAMIDVEDTRTIDTLTPRDMMIGDLADTMIDQDMMIDHDTVIEHQEMTEITTDLRGMIDHVTDSLLANQAVYALALLYHLRTLDEPVRAFEKLSLFPA